MTTWNECMEGIRAMETSAAAKASVPRETAMTRASALVGRLEKLQESLEYLVGRLEGPRPRAVEANKPEAPASEHLHRRFTQAEALLTECEDLVKLMDGAL